MANSKQEQTRARSQTELATAPVGWLLLKLAFPCIAAQIVNVLYNIVDRMYIRHIPGVGPNALTGIGVTAPILTAISAFPCLICMGAAPQSAIYLGRNEKKSAEKIMSASFVLLCVCALVLTFLVEFGGQSFLALFGASESTIEYAWSYLQIYALGTFFVESSPGMNAFINSQGYSS